MMKYTTYNKMDFAADEYFIQWVYHPNAENCRFWETFLANFPHKREDVKAARRIVMQLSEKSSFGRLPEEIWGKVQNEIQSGPGRSGNTPLKKWHERKRVLTTIVAVCILGMSLFFINNMGLLDKETASQPPQITLQLQDGTEQVIDETTSKVITTGNGQALGNQDKDLLVYSKTQQNATEPVYNTLTVPYGKKFGLVLADGSHITLNAGSKLRYPVQFLPGKPRDVYLDGEAFFEVEKDKERPFTVVTEKMNTRVYGTRFNVTSYKNEQNTYTVLVEGSVGVYGTEDSIVQNEPLKIVPGQKATFENGRIDVEKVNIRKYTAWTAGELYFLNDRFDLILKKLERHYNITIDNSYPKINTEHLTSSFTQGAPLELVLNILKKLQPFNYRMDGNTVIITPPN
ncbi:FecR family protein [Sinomicrobium weinanense]|uniref:DUF4974 domain-containing protein n=1 Tax=Sinomicrobium weinanense TaxID=2842200 RepID=A0A926Q2W5_9FLAO|nr:FecR family protein [Sinomicrobium weinanense]MBC9795371.1 DUF4974 domain-containing protein [Sinomicrobium weinanense]MBU3122914.1 DUF4974 domain-containing protein [Sinomicrobium weinanense]